MTTHRILHVSGLMEPS